MPSAPWRPSPMLSSSRRYWLSWTHCSKAGSSYESSVCNLRLLFCLNEVSQLQESAVTLDVPLAVLPCITDVWRAVCTCSDLTLHVSLSTGRTPPLRH